jgi:hypothetical protein
MPSVSPFRLLPGLLLVVLLALPATADAARRVERGGPPPAGSGPITLKTFLRAVDGETLEVFIKGRQVGVRVAGVSTPRPNTTCGRAATDALQGLVAGGGRLHDVRGVVFDRRKLRVYRVTDLKGTGVASKLALAGVVRAVRGQGASRAVIAAERRARAARRGCLWNSAARRRAAAKRKAAARAAERRATSPRRGRAIARAASTTSRPASPTR